MELQSPHISWRISSPHPYLFNLWSGPDFLQEPELNQTFLSIFYDLLPGVLLVAALISIYFLCQSVKIWIMFPILFWVCVSIFLTPQLTCWGEIEFKRCYKISNVPAGMHLVVLLLSRHSPHWNSISSQQFVVSPNLYTLNNFSPFFKSSS